MFRNALRGLKIADTDFWYLSEGAYSLVFADRVRGRVLKVFRTEQDPKHAKKVYLAELAALETASSSNDLKGLVPTYFGTRQGIKMVDRGGNDVSNEIYGDLAFEMEFINGRFEKSSFATTAERQRVHGLLIKNGIKHVEDTSVRLEEGKITKVIDFHIEHIEPQADPL